MNTTFGASGRCATASRSSRSQHIVSTPASRSVRSVSGEENRDTAITRRTCVPSASRAARIAMRASVGPILPPAPRTTRSPGQAASARTVAVCGSDSSASSPARVDGFAFIACAGSVTSARRWDDRGRCRWMLGAHKRTESHERFMGHTPEELVRRRVGRREAAQHQRFARFN